MGAANVAAAYTLYAGQIPATSMLLLAWMALVARDDDPRPWYGQGHAALATGALGRGCNTAVSPADIKAVERAITPLLRTGAIVADRQASVRRDGPNTVRYRLNIRVPNPPGPVHDANAPAGSRPSETVADVPRNPSPRPPLTVLSSPENRGTEEPGGTTRSEEEEEGVEQTTAVTVSRARDNATTPIRDTRHRCAHGLPLQRRRDGNPSCALCRRQQASPADRPT